MTRGRPRGKPEDAYHHGDLRRALVEEATVIVREEGPLALSLRELARRLGVSYGAPHYHFAERDDLFAAIAEAGFKRIVAATERRLAEATPASPRDALLVVARAYLGFAKREPQIYRTMFLPQLNDRARFAELHATGGSALEALAALFEASGTPKAAARRRAIACWSTLHGFALLANDSFFDETGKALAQIEEAVIAAACDAPMDGGRPPMPPAAGALDGGRPPMPPAAGALE